MYLSLANLGRISLFLKGGSHDANSVRVVGKRLLIDRMQIASNPHGDDRGVPLYFISVNACILFISSTWNHGVNPSVLALFSGESCDIVSWHPDKRQVADD